MSIRALLKEIGAARDGVLVVVSATYVVGLLAWSFRAWRLGLGIVPAVDAQYFTIGAAISVVVVVAALAVRRVKHFNYEVWEPYFRSLPAEKQRSLADAVYTWTPVPITYGIWRMMRTGASEPNAEFLAGVLLSYIGLMFARQPTSQAAPMTSAVNRTMTYTTFPFVATLLIAGFVLNGYSHVPQVLGGGAPRIAQLEITTAAMSLRTTAELCGAMHGPMPAVVRTNDVHVLAELGTTVVISVPGTATRPPRVMQLRRDVISAVIWKR